MGEKEIICNCHAEPMHRDIVDEEGYQEISATKEVVLWWMVVIILTLAVLAAVCLWPRSASAEEISQSRAVLAIIGEAENQGYDGMLAVAGAIRNRGTLRGVYGEKAPRVIGKKYTNKIYNQAVRAWEESKTRDISNGATHWENIKAFGRPDWSLKMKEVFRHKDHVFYK